MSINGINKYLPVRSMKHAIEIRHSVAERFGYKGPSSGYHWYSLQQLSKTTGSRPKDSSNKFLIWIESHLPATLVNSLKERKRAVQYLDSYHLSRFSNPRKLEEALIKAEQSYNGNADKLSAMILNHTPTNKAPKRMSILQSKAPHYGIQKASQITFPEYVLLRRLAIREVDGTKISRKLKIKTLAETIGKAEGYLYKDYYSGELKSTEKWSLTRNEILKYYKLNPETATVFDLLKALTQREVDRKNFDRVILNSIYRQ